MSEMTTQPSDLTDLAEPEQVQPAAPAAPAKPKLGAKDRQRQPPHRAVKLPDDPNDRRGLRALALDREQVVDIEGPKR
jgi:hypothetical protein